MGRFLALDLGKVRTGIAVTDELKLIASGLTTIPTSELIATLEEYLKNETVEVIVVGEPRQMNNEPSESEVLILEIIKKLRKAFPKLPIVRQDERFTSMIAQKSLLQSGHKKKKRREKALVDEISATLILQAYLDRVKK